jgi:glycosyltransferase involved in cell wall biosynthesis
MPTTPTHPPISIVLPFRDAAATLCDCLDSIRGQTFGDYELLAIDDGSSDQSAVIARRYAESDPRIRMLETDGSGLVPALNLGLAHARAPLIARMDADDRMRPERLAAQATYLSQHPDIALVGTQVELFPPDAVRAGYREYARWQNGVLSPEDVANNIYVESPFAHPSVMLRREVFEQVGGYADGQFPEDYELWLRMHQAGLRMAKIAQVLLDWRERPGRASRVDPRYARAAFDTLRARFLSRDPRLLQGRPVVVWGAGRKTRLRARLLIDQGIRPVAWVDVDPAKIGHVVWGLPVRHKDWLDRQGLPEYEAGPRPFVLVFVTSHGARELIAGWLGEWGYRPGADFLPVG